MSGPASVSNIFDTLEGAAAVMLTVQAGDWVPVRTYGDEGVGREMAYVARIGRRFAMVELFNATYRMRLRDSPRLGPAGMIMGLESWGLDMERTIERAGVRKEHPERAGWMLRGVKPGYFLPLIGYPPMDGHKLDAFVTAVTPQYVTLRVGRRKAKMHRTGPLAGIIEGEVYVLDTTDAE